MRALLTLLLLAAVACSAERAVDGTDGSMHGPGILDPDSDDFHGKLAARVDWDLSTCARCHDPGKPGAAPSCARCHGDGPSGCTSCHAMPPATGAHRAHASSGAPDSCRTCHPTPAHWMELMRRHNAFYGARCNQQYVEGFRRLPLAFVNYLPAYEYLPE